MFFVMAFPSGFYINVCQCMMIDKNDTAWYTPFFQSNIQNIADSLPFEDIYWTQDKQASVIIMPNLNVPSNIFHWRRSRAFVTLPRASSDQDLTNIHQFVDKLSSQFSYRQPCNQRNHRVAMFLCFDKLPAWKNRHQSLIVFSGEAVYFLCPCH